MGAGAKQGIRAMRAMRVMGLIFSPAPSKPSLFHPPQVQLPVEDSELDARQYDDERGEVGGYGGAQVWKNSREQN